jgi:8-oxo-dGTP diphosphatase
MIVEDLNFTPDRYAVACHIIYNGRILYVKRKLNKPQGGKWGCIGGKVEKGEDNLTAIQREVQEETGLTLEKEDFKYIRTWNAVFNKKEKNSSYLSFTYSLYQVNFEKKPNIILPEDELDEYDWFTPEEALKHDLFQDEDNVLKEIYKISI